jgi:hypothetical protein
MVEYMLTIEFRVEAETTAKKRKYQNLTSDKFFGVKHSALGKHLGILSRWSTTPRKLP